MEYTSDVTLDYQEMMEAIITSGITDISDSKDMSNSTVLEINIMLQT